MNMTGTTCAYQTCDVDEQATLLRGWNQTYHQLSAGSFSGSLIEADLGDIVILREFTSQALHQTGALPEDRIAIGMLLASSSPPLFCGSVCDEGKAIVFSGSDAFEFHSPGMFEILDFVIDRNTLRERLDDEESHVLLAQRRKPHLRTLQQAHRQQLHQLAQDIFRQIRCRESCCPSSSQEQTPGMHAAQALREELLDTLTEALQTGADATTGTTRPQQIRLVEEARALMRARMADAQLSVLDICRQLGVARRTLQYAFQNILGTSPLQYLRALRLNGARQAIKQHQRVADAATAWGFWHFGRFSREYRLMFGELPSETLRRAQGG